jgi:type II secretory ATPase GspE/PulE/Tfp pilus assembly ATPase PilB-like protein
MLTLKESAPTGAAAVADLPLPYEVREKTRLRAALASGEEVALFLKRGTVLRGGDLLRGELTESLDDLRALASREPVIQVVNAMLAEASRAGASDVHVESRPDGLRVRNDAVAALDPLLETFLAAFPEPDLAGALPLLKRVRLDLNRRRHGG